MNITPRDIFVEFVSTSVKGDNEATVGVVQTAIGAVQTHYFKSTIPMNEILNIANILSDEDKSVNWEFKSMGFCSGRGSVMAVYHSDSLGRSMVINAGINPTIQHMIDYASKINSANSDYNGDDWYYVSNCISDFI